MLTTHLHLAPRVRMSGAVPVLPLYAFMAWTGETLPFFYFVRSGLYVPTFATRRLHAYHHARAPSGGRLNCRREMSGNFA